MCVPLPNICIIANKKNSILDYPFIEIYKIKSEITEHITL